MLFWIIFGISAALYAVSMIRDMRRFRNAVYLMIVLFFLALALTFSAGKYSFIIVLFIYGMWPLCIAVASVIFISAGITAIRKEGFSLSHCMSILFAVAIWGGLFLAILMFSNVEMPKLFSALAVLILLAEAYIIFTFTALFLYCQLYRILPKKKKCGFVIIHGAGLIDGLSPTPLLAGRLDKGMEVFKRAGDDAKIIVSGGQGSDEKVSEAEAMAEYLLVKGIPRSKIILEDKSKTTLENVKFSQEIVNSVDPNSRCIFVTSDFHVFRTGLYTKKFHLNADGVGSRTASYYFPNAFIREYAAIMLIYKKVPIAILALWVLFVICICI